MIVEFRIGSAGTVYRRSTVAASNKVGSEDKPNTELFAAIRVPTASSCASELRVNFVARSDLVQITLGNLRYFVKVA
jgi:hypothetical protein